MAITMEVGRDSSVGIATRYGLECPGIETRWGRNFPHQSRPALGTPGTGGKVVGRGVVWTTHLLSNAEVK